MQLIAVESLKEGMVLAQDVVSDSFVHIIAESTIVTKDIISKLEQLNIEFVYVHSDYVPEEAVDFHDSEPEFQKLDSKEALKYNYNKSIKCIKSIFNDLKFGDAEINDELDEVIEPLLKGVLSHNNILSSLRYFDPADDYILKHAIEVGVLSASIGKWMGLKGSQISELAMAGMLHDIGKIKIPRYVLNKPGHLSPQEFSIAKRHAMHGYEYLKADGGFSESVCQGVLYHHERFNGTGYPNGLRGKEIPLYARIIAVADIFDALISDKVYQLRVSPFKAAEIIKNMSFEELDPEIANLFLKKISEHYVGNKVLLSTGEEGEVVYLNKYDINKPLIKVGDKFIDLTTQSNIIIKDVL